MKKINTKIKDQDNREILGMIIEATRLAFILSSGQDLKRKDQLSYLELTNKLFRKFVLEQYLKQIK